MTEQRHFEGLVFDAGLRLAWTGQGEEVKLTRRERDLMRRFLANPGRVLSRDQLLDTFNVAGSDTLDRNIDYVVHRLRQKLGDRARTPRYIETLYGEGYIWVGRPVDPGAGPLLLMLGGIAADGQRSEHEDIVLQRLAAGLAVEFGDTVVLRPHWRHSEESGHAAYYALGADFLDLDNVIHVALVLRHVPTNEIVGTFRLSALAAPPDDTDIAAMAGAVRDAVWSHVARPSGLAATPYDPPLELRLIEAAMMFAPDASVWEETMTRLKHVPGQRAEKPEHDVLLGLGVMCRLVMGHNGQFASMAEWRDAEEDMEAMALRALPGVQHDPLLTLAVSRLLHFSHRGHLALAEELARHSFSSGTAFGAASVMLGLIHMARGASDDAIACFKRALDRSAEGGLYWRFITVLQCTALIAAGRRQEVNQLAAALFQQDPSTRAQLGVFLLDPDMPAKGPELDVLLAAIDPGMARRLVVYLYMAHARHFEVPVQRMRVMEGLLVFLSARFALAELCSDLPDADGAMLVRCIEAQQHARLVGQHAETVSVLPEEGDATG